MPPKGFRKSHCINGHIRNPENTGKACKQCIKTYGESSKQKKKRHSRLLEIKVKVLSYYGKQGLSQCNWPECLETDIDTLTLDHIENDGYKDRNVNKGSSKLYSRLIRECFPKGFQTLCANHQLKKEIMRRRSLLEVSSHAE